MQLVALFKLCAWYDLKSQNWGLVRLLISGLLKTYQGWVLRVQANVFVVTSTARAAFIAACAYCIRMAYAIIMFSGNLF